MDRRILFYDTDNSHKPDPSCVSCLEVPRECARWCWRRELAGIQIERGLKEYG